MAVWLVENSDFSWGVSPLKTHQVVETLSFASLQKKLPELTLLLLEFDSKKAKFDLQLTPFVRSANHH